MERHRVVLQRDDAAGASLERQALLAERQRLLGQQAGLLRGYILAGKALPEAVATGDTAAAGACTRRDGLVAQLAHEDGAARAALEALKLGASLAQAREVGQRILRQAQDMGGGQAGAAGGSAPPACVLLRETRAAHDAPAASPEAEVQPEVTDAPRQVSKCGTTAGSLSGSVVVASRRDGEAAVLPEHTAPRCGAGAVPWPTQAAGADIDTDAQQLPDSMVQLHAQLTAVQAMLGPQLRPRAAAAAGGPAVPTRGPLDAQSPLDVLTALVAAVASQQDCRGRSASAAPCAPPAAPTAVCATAPVTLMPPGLLASDPELCAAAAAHARHMALLRMQLESARGAAELQQLHAQLAAPHGGAAPPAPQTPLWQHRPHGLTAEPSAAPAAPTSGCQQLGMQLFQQPPGKPDLPEEPQPGWTPTAGSPQAAHMGASPADADADESASMGEVLPVSPHGGCALAEEALAPEVGSALLAARGSCADASVLQIQVSGAGPFGRRGSYRVSALLYSGHQPLQSALGEVLSASTGARAVAPPGACTLGAAGGPGAAAQACAAHEAGCSAAAAGYARWSECLVLRGMQLSAGTPLTLVFLLHATKPGLAGLPPQEAPVAWASTPLAPGGSVPAGMQSVPLYRLPLVLGSARHYSYEHALLDFSVSVRRDVPGDLEQRDADAQAPSAGGLHTGAVAGAQAAEHEDVPGVPAAAWLRVSRGVPPADPYNPGDGFVVLLDGARFLPDSTTISRVSGAVLSRTGALLAGPFQGTCAPDGDALSPRYSVAALLGSGSNGTRIEDPTATLQLQVHTVERRSRCLRLVGCALLALFLDPKAGGQPMSRSLQDYVLNSGAFQVPLHAGTPAGGVPLRMSSLDDVPRLPCASLLLRIVSPEAAKQARRRPPPAYSERVYDTASRASPTPLERRLYAQLLARPPLAARDAARIVAWYRRQPGGLGGSQAGASQPWSGSRADRGSPAHSKPSYWQQGTRHGGFLARVLGGSSGADGGGGTQDGSPSAGAYTGELGAAVRETPSDLESAKGEALPGSDPELLDWMDEAIDEAAVEAGVPHCVAQQAGVALRPPPPLICLSTCTSYSTALGFFVALDGAARITRPLPTAGLVSYAPPGGLYQDQPLLDDVRVTLDYDLDAPLAAPRWLDGYQQYSPPYCPGLVLLVDVRALVPGSSSSAPLGWAVLPVFEAAGPYVAAGAYQLPLFQGIPSAQLLAELATSEDPDAVVCEAIASGRVRPTLDRSSVMLRLMCGSSAAALDVPAWSLPAASLRVPAYAAKVLGPRFLADMRLAQRGRTYGQAKPHGLAADVWLAQINDTLIRAAGLDEQLPVGGGAGDSGDDDDAAPWS